MNENSGRVLFVDDEECIREIAIEAFSHTGFNIILANNGVEALEKLWDSVFDVVVADIMMPKLNGIDLYYDSIKDNPKLKDRFIFTTGLPSLKTVSFLSQNSCPHLYKPYKMADLIHMVEVVMESKKESSEYRFAKRFDLVTGGLLTDGSINKRSPLVVETQNISKSGIKLKYLGSALIKNAKVEINLRAMDIKRSARVVWSNTIDECSFSGLAFA